MLVGKYDNAALRCLRRCCEGDGGVSQSTSNEKRSSASKSSYASRFAMCSIGSEKGSEMRGLLICCLRVNEFCWYIKESGGWAYSW